MDNIGTTESTQAVNPAIVESAISSNMMESSSTETPRPRRRRRNFKSFQDALEFSRSLKLKSRKEWRLWVKGEMPNVAPKPDDVPAHPDGVYKINGWQGWRHWLGTQVSSNELN